MARDGRDPLAAYGNGWGRKALERATARARGLGWKNYRERSVDASDGSALRVRRYARERRPGGLSGAPRPRRAPRAGVSWRRRASLGGDGEGPTRFFARRGALANFAAGRAKKGHNRRDFRAPSPSRGSRAVNPRDAGRAALKTYGRARSSGKRGRFWGAGMASAPQVLHAKAFPREKDSPLSRGGPQGEWGR